MQNDVLRELPDCQSNLGETNFAEYAYVGISVGHNGRTAKLSISAIRQFDGSTKINFGKENKIGLSAPSIGMAETSQKLVIQQ